eukprot:9618887-Lingulodinium_polyedra.AAC.1
MMRPLSIARPRGPLGVIAGVTRRRRFAGPRRVLRWLVVGKGRPRSAAVEGCVFAVIAAGRAASTPSGIAFG